MELMVFDLNEHLASCNEQDSQRLELPNADNAISVNPVCHQNLLRWVVRLPRPTGQSLGQSDGSDM